MESRTLDDEPAPMLPEDTDRTWVGDAGVCLPLCAAGACMAPKRWTGAAERGDQRLQPRKLRGLHWQVFNADL